ncbi:hypothetical protein LSCM1_04186 [Leishmania martiniquensis]|uniref:Uncharacterized protein n=1 Tax=Leishmania martiniquensis TaxID=1580590 RepID=A0A836KHT5_9TRYP|nr:hypothetical protein LSCM1_04186 [Leishmania martiniquensis]
MGSTPVEAASAAVPLHSSDALDALQELLTNFVMDSMYDRPNDILEYMVLWARRQLLQEQEGSETVTVAARKASCLSITPTNGAASIQAAVFSETPDGEEPGVDVEAEAASRLRHFAEYRRKHYRDIAQGHRDRYLISLEDSDGDFSHVNMLRCKMADARQQEMNARADADTIAVQLQAIEEGAGAATEKTREQAALLHEYEQRWAHEKLRKCPA